MTLLTRPFVLWLLDYLLNSAWQVPAILLAALAAARLGARLGPAAVHRIWTAALLLAILLPACRFPLWSLPWFLHGVEPGAESIQVTVLPVLAAGPADLRWPPVLLGIVLVAYAGTVLYSLGALAYGLRGIRRIRRAAIPLAADLAGRAGWAALYAQMGRPHVELAIAGGIAGPMVLGARPALLLLPAGFLDRVSEEDAQAALAHELAHVRRNDFVRNLACLLLSVPVAWHPCMRLLRARLAESREMACDATAAAVLGGRRHYAGSLLRLAAVLPATPGRSALPVVGMFDGNTLERRVNQMIHQQKELNRAGRAATVAALLLLTAGAGASVTGMHLNVEAAAKPAAEKAPSKLSVSPEVMAGLAEIKVQPVYPAEAKANHDTVDGTVVLSAVIDKEGAITDLQVKKSLREDYDRSALDGVQQWRYKPYLLNGEPVAVETTISVTYTIGK